MTVKSSLRRLGVHGRNESGVVLLQYLMEQDRLGDPCVVGCAHVYYDVL
jgi:hypothetical protein